MIGPAPARCWTLPGVPESVRTFRSLARAESATAHQSELAELCVSELVTNAIQHTWSGWPGGMVTVTFCTGRSPGELRITVTDDGDMGAQAGPWLWPGPETGEPAESGRGLSIVDALAADWGRSSCPPRGWSVWCLLMAAPDDPNPRTAADLARCTAAQGPHTSEMEIH
jgi:serine/threonine-protein kinase RsbW